MNVCRTIDTDTKISRVLLSHMTVKDSTFSTCQTWERTNHRGRNWAELAAFFPDSRSSLHLSGNRSSKGFISFTEVSFRSK